MAFFYWITPAHSSSAERVNELNGRGQAGLSKHCRVGAVPVAEGRIPEQMQGQLGGQCSATVAGGEKPSLMRMLSAHSGLVSED